MAELLFSLKDQSQSKWPQIIAILAFLYSLLSVIGTGEAAVYWGFVLLMSGIPFYVKMKSEQKEIS